MLGMEFIFKYEKWREVHRGSPQIHVKFYQLFATIIRGEALNLENLRKTYEKYRSFDERGEGSKKKAVLQWVWRFLRFFGKGCSSQKSWNLIARGERASRSNRFELLQAILWQKWPKSSKKCQMRKISQKKIFQSSKKGQKRWKKLF